MSSYREVPCQASEVGRPESRLEVRLVQPGGWNLDPKDIAFRFDLLQIGP